MTSGAVVIAARDTGSISATLPGNVPRTRYLSLREAAELISEIIGRRVAAGTLRSYWSQDSPAILPMKRARTTTKVGTILQIPEWAVRRAAAKWPKPPGRPVQVSAATKARILELLETGASYQGIANELKAEGIRTPTGQETWEPRTIYQIIQREKRRGESDGGDQHADP